MFVDEICLIFEDAAANATWGLDVQLDALPWSTDFKRVKTPKVVSVATKPEIADGELGSNFPVLAIRQDGPLALPTRNGNMIRDLNGSIQFAVAVNKPDDHLAFRYASRILWAWYRVLQNLYRPANVAVRTRPGVLLDPPPEGDSTTSIDEILEEVNGGFIIGVMRQQIRAKDRQPGV